jgi:hypothetical protein
MDLPHNERNWLPAYYFVICAATSTLVLIRLLSRVKRIGGTFGYDDLFITIAWLLSICAGTLSVIGRRTLPLGLDVN